MQKAVLHAEDTAAERIRGGAVGRTGYFCRIQTDVIMRYLLVLFSLVFVFCKNKTTENQLIVALPQTILHEAPGEKSRDLGTLKQSERLTDLGEVSHFETTLQLADKTHQAPWLKVRTADGKEGWVFGRAVEPALRPADWMLQKRMACYFGPTLTARRNNLVNQPDQLVDETGFAAYYRQSVALRDTLTQLLASRPEPGEADFRPDFSWLSEVLPGFLFQEVAERTQPWLFAAYPFFLEKALATTGKQDDQFIAVCLTAFPTDSVESFFPVWQFQISDYEAASRLGEGYHLKMLQAIEGAWVPGILFRPELTILKDQILEDILAKNTAFWQPKEKIVPELKKITTTRLMCLTEQDRSDLQHRLSMFNDNGIRVNLRSGE